MKAAAVVVFLLLVAIFLFREDERIETRVRSEIEIESEIEERESQAIRPVRAPIAEPIEVPPALASDDWPCGEDGTCSMARACVEGRCVPCASDEQCGGAEVCVDAHCVLSDLAKCRAPADCLEPDTKCVLSGITPGTLRGNEETTADCLSLNGGREVKSVSQRIAAPREEDTVAEGDLLAEELGSLLR